MSDTDTSATEFLDDFNGRIRQLIPEVHDFIPLHEPHIATEAESYVLDCLRSGWVSSVGPLVAEFEERVRNRVGSSFAVATVNGTAALHLALLALGVERGDEVILPSLTFVATGNAVSYCGAVPHFVDVETQGMGLCPGALRERASALQARHWMWSRSVSRCRSSRLQRRTTQSMGAGSGTRCRLL